MNSNLLLEIAGFLSMVAQGHRPTNLNGQAADLLEKVGRAVEDRTVVWGVFKGKDSRVHFSIGVQTFTLDNAALGDEEEAEHLEHQRRSLETALRGLSGSEPAPLAALANKYLAEP